MHVVENFQNVPGRDEIHDLANFHWPEIRIYVVDMGGLLPNRQEKREEILCTGTQ